MADKLSIRLRKTPGAKPVDVLLMNYGTDEITKLATCEDEAAALDVAKRTRDGLAFVGLNVSKPIFWEDCNVSWKPVGPGLGVEG